MQRVNFIGRLVCSLNLFFLYLLTLRCAAGLDLPQVLGASALRRLEFPLLQLTPVCVFFSAASPAGSAGLYSST